MHDFAFIYAAIQAAVIRILLQFAGRRFESKRKKMKQLAGIASLNPGEDAFALKGERLSRMKL